MSAKLMRVCLALLLVLLFAGQAAAYQVFVWRHDNNLRATDPVLGGTPTATESVVRTLTALRIPWDSSSVLPDDLSRYDVVVTCLSFYCPG
ncbi:MAG: hypothetical protein FJY65_06555 [Calditrichaeota bacterium]|nr:hypothetical protein [Calditrichota bacterium]